MLLLPLLIGNEKGELVLDIKYSVADGFYRFVANKWLKTHMEFSVDQKVEWLYAFDIHCNRLVRKN